MWIFSNIQISFNQDEPICSSGEQKTCVENLVSDPSTECLPRCDGILVTSFMKTENFNEAEVVTPELLNQYNNYKQFIPFPEEIKGIYYAIKLG